MLFIIIFSYHDVCILALVHMYLLWLLFCIPLSLFFILLKTELLFNKQILVHDVFSLFHFCLREHINFFKNYLFIYLLQINIYFWVTYNIWEVFLPWVLNVL